MHRPVVYEFSRLNVSGSVLSKRKIKKLISNGHIEDFDDPRLLTVVGLRKRGYTSKSLLDCIRQLGHTRNVSTLNIELLESYIRNELNTSAPRLFGVIDPLELIIDNFDDLEENCKTEFERPLHPMHDFYGTRKIGFKKSVYINREDFREEANKKYYRLTKKQKIRLKYTSGLIEYISHDTDDNNEIICIHVKYTPDTVTKVKGCLGWVSKERSIPAKFNIYSQLLDDNNNFNTESLVVKTGLIESYIKLSRKRVQLERMGYYFVFKIDDVSGVELNQIVSLRESKGKKGLIKK